MEFHPEQASREAVARAFDEHRRAIQTLLSGAVIEHIGSSAVPEALTKGDLDLLVSVPVGEFKAATEVLSARYAIHQRDNWTGTFASFRQKPPGMIAVGIQLVVRGSGEERLFLEWRERLIGEPALLADYNALKSSHIGADPEEYVTIKARFIESHLDRRSV